MLLHVLILTGDSCCYLHDAFYDIALSTAAIHCLERSHAPAVRFPEAVTSDFSPADYLIYHGNSLRSSALLTSTPAQLGMNEKFFTIWILSKTFTHLLQH